MKEINLSTQGKNKNKYVALVDDEDFNYLNQWRWSVQYRGNGIYYASRLDSNSCKKYISMHRLIMKVSDIMFIDHIDHNGLNNQKSNLRICTHVENMKNRRSARNHSSKYLGVAINIGSRKYINKRGELKVYYSKPKYVAHIKINGKNYDIGRYDTEIEAAMAYNSAARLFHKKYANLNIVEKLF